MTMEFKWANKACLLQGTNIPTLQQASLEAISKEVRHNNSIFAICMSQQGETQHSIPPDMQALLEVCADIFE